jgi:predicted ATP-dependent serine protease
MQVKPKIIYECEICGSKFEEAFGNCSSVEKKEMEKLVIELHIQKHQEA